LSFESAVLARFYVQGQPVGVDLRRLLKSDS
jgi:hypothetical protein